ncbi:MAG: DUF2298 domain-containing protein [Chloroflexota bacterium]
MTTMQREKHPWIYDVLVIAVLAVAAFLRLSGADWGELQHQHPDELFLTGVLANLRAHECLDESVPIDACPTEQQRWIGLDDYFDTKNSTLNPHNRGFAFFVYGTLPMFIIRYTAEIVGQTDYGQLKLLGRQFSALADLGTILLLYVIAARLYNRRTALLAAAFSAFAAMQIQQSHFFTTDLFVNLFSFMAIYFAVLIVENREQRVENSKGGTENDHAHRTQLTILYSLLSNPLCLLSIGFGFSFGLALASKVNIYPLALLLPAAFLLRYFTTERKEQTADEKPPIATKEQPAIARLLQSLTTDYWSLVTACLVVGGLAAFLAFRLFQPYAFNGLLPNQQWLDNIAEQRVQARGDADLPWNLQWARRTHLYSFTNLTVWGLGLPLGVLAWAGFLVMGWRILKGERRHLLLWGWTAFYFTWQSLQFNPTMRYQLPIYPLLAMMAAWVVFELANASTSRITHHRLRITHYALRTIGLLVLIATAIWAFAFQSIYTREETRLAASRWIYQNAPAPINLRIQLADGSVYNQPVSFPSGALIQPGSPYGTNFSAARDGLLTEVSLGHVADTLASGPQTLSLLAANQPDPTPEQALAKSTLTGDFAPTTDPHFGDFPRGAPATLVLTPPLQVKEGEIFFLHFETTGGALTLSGATIANETDYDYSLPFRTEYDGFGGIYRGDLNFQVYWDDNADKLARFTETLDQTDYILIPTNHQYAQITRLPERYPLTTVYYRELLGCPSGQNIIECYREAEPGMFEGRLGFELIKTFTSYPTLGPLVINDQAAEEAFTFYDHPKVMIFQKRADYDPAQVRAILGSVDLTDVVHLTPREASTYKDLMLSDESLAIQRAGGTWSELFDYDHLQNKYPLIGLVIWYVFIFVLGALTYPIIRLALPGLGQQAYPLARTLGLVILAYVPWLLGSLGAPYSRGTIGLVFAVIAVAGLGLGWMRREELAAEWKSSRRYFLIVEAVFLSFFLFDLLIRLGNPDLWHPAKGGERPMDFSYFNAVLKSTTFPPYDPWFAGGYINYYYYGFVLVGAPVKLLGIVPSIAYNFLLPTWFALTAVNAFTVGFNLVERGKTNAESDAAQASTFDLQPVIAGLSAALLMTALGNLGTIQMVFQALARIAAPGGSIADSHFFQRLVWAGEGLYKTIAQGVALPIGRGEWYWNPSRVIPPGPGNEITEFPFFTFLYSDLHAHMIVMPLALFVVAWALGAILARRTSLLSLAVGALVIGALYPANLSDMYTYLPVGLTALAYALWRADEGALPRWLPNVSPFWGLSPQAKRLIWIALSIAILTALSFGFYSPYRAAYSQAYSKLDPWTATQTPLTSYLTHWGLFLFVIFAWLAWETREWMAATPVSALGKLKPFQLLIELALALFIVALLYLAYRKIWIGWIALPMAAWAGILLLRPQLADTKRLALFWIGTALVVTLVVELVTVRGDIGRMNTIFKFYLQVWALLSVSAGAAFVWTLTDVHKWRLRWRNTWQGGVIILVSGALLFTVTATTDKVNDRINPDAPHSFDTMEYMAHSEYWDAQTMDLSQDYRAIRWMQDNVKGSPVIVETNCPEYRWCSRFTIYTGLPGVVGWNWHQRQQRALVPPNLVTDRVDAIGAFYNSTDAEFARAFLAQYDVRYIVVGQLEAIYYPDGGLAKFEQLDGTLWKSVYHDAQTTIYEVLP